MDYAQRNPAKNLSGFALVVILHVAIGYALVSGLARKVVEVIKAPIETKIIEEVRKPPPDIPPPPPPPKLAAPPPPFIPPPEITIKTPPPPPQQTITTVTTTPPPPGPPPKVYTPPPPAAPPAPPAPPAPAVRTNFAALSKVPVTYPRLALRRGITGKVVALMSVSANGSVTNVKILSSTNRMFDREVERALMQWKYAPEPTGFFNKVEIEFNLTD